MYAKQIHCPSINSGIQHLTQHFMCIPSHNIFEEVLLYFCGFNRILFECLRLFCTSLQKSFRLYSYSCTCVYFTYAMYACDSIHEYINTYCMINVRHIYFHRMRVRDIDFIVFCFENQSFSSIVFIIELTAFKWIYLQCVVKINSCGGTIENIPHSTLCCFTLSVTIDKLISYIELYWELREK